MHSEHCEVHSIEEIRGYALFYYFGEEYFNNAKKKKKEIRGFQEKVIIENMEKLGRKR